MPKVNSEKFFKTQSAESRVKADIVSGFTRAWANVFLGPKHNPFGTAEAAYIDLFSGPGIYGDGSLSTPMLVMETALDDTKLQKGLRIFFNDENRELIGQLRQHIEAMPQSNQLRFPINFTNAEASVSLVRSLGLKPGLPRLYFLDQFGWADVKPELITEIFKAPKCDCLLFLRTSRLIAAVTNSKATSSLEKLFSHERVAELKASFDKALADKESLVLEVVRQVAEDAGATLFQAFPFRVTEDHATKHHLIYLGRHPLPLRIIREIMSTKSSFDEFGVPIIGYASAGAPRTLSLFATDPIEELCNELLLDFSGRSFRVIELYFRHQSKNSRFILTNYQEALRRLEASGSVVCEPALNERPKRNGRVTMSETVKVTFRREG